MVTLKHYLQLFSTRILTGQVVVTNELDGEPLFEGSIGSIPFTVTNSSNDEPVVTFADNARVIVRDIMAVNGIIHILSDVAGT